MATKIKGKVQIELYPIPFAKNKNDHYARINLRKSINEEHLIKEVVKRRSELHPSTLRAVLEMIKDIAIEEIMNGSSVRLGPATFQLKANGVFKGPHDNWDAQKHELHLQAKPTRELLEEIKHCKVQVFGAAQKTNIIGTIYDYKKDVQNECFTRGGVAKITGKNIKIVGDKQGVGIFLRDIVSDQMHQIPPENIFRNTPKELEFIIPKTMVLGEYQLSVGTQHSPAFRILKQLRNVLYKHTVKVVD